MLKFKTFHSINIIYTYYGFGIYIKNALKSCLRIQIVGMRKFCFTSLLEFFEHVNKHIDSRDPVDIIYFGLSKRFQ